METKHRAESDRQASSVYSLVCTKYTYYADLKKTDSNFVCPNTHIRVPKRTDSNACASDLSLFNRIVK